MKLGASLPAGQSPADVERLAWGQRFRAWIDDCGWTAAHVRKLCGVSASTVSKWRAGDVMPGEKHRQALERMGFNIDKGDQ